MNRSPTAPTAERVPSKTAHREPFPYPLNTLSGLGQYFGSLFRDFRIYNSGETYSRTGQLHPGVHMRRQYKRIPPLPMSATKCEDLLTRATYSTERMVGWWIGWTT